MTPGNNPPTGARGVRVSPLVLRRKGQTGLEGAWGLGGERGKTRSSSQAQQGFDHTLPNSGRIYVKLQR